MNPQQRPRPVTSLGAPVPVTSPDSPSRDERSGKLALRPARRHEADHLRRSCSCAVRYAKPGSHESGPPSSPRTRGSIRLSSFPRKRESMLSVSRCDDSRGLTGNRWIPAFAGMTVLSKRTVSPILSMPILMHLTIQQTHFVASRA